MKSKFLYLLIFSLGYIANDSIEKLIKPVYANGCDCDYLDFSLDVQNDINMAINQLQWKLESRIDDVEGRIDNVESKINDVEGRIDDVESRIDNVESKISGSDYDFSQAVEEIIENCSVINDSIDC